MLLVARFCIIFIEYNNFLGLMGLRLRALGVFTKQWRSVNLDPRSIGSAGYAGAVDAVLMFHPPLPFRVCVLLCLALFCTVCFPLQLPDEELWLCPACNAEVTARQVG